MYIIFSPSKKQLPQQSVRPTNPRFQDMTDLLYQKLSSLSQVDLAQYFKISDKVSGQLHTAYKNKDVYGNALSSYSGNSFLRLDLKNYSNEDWKFAQKHLRILSGMYGILKPKDRIKVHRIDLSDNVDWMNLDHNLYGYWRDVVNNELQKTDTILNLASGEYSKILSPDNYEKLTDVHFRVNSNGAFKNISVFSKQQRGSMLDYIIKNKITDFKKLRNYSNDGFVFDTDASDKGCLVFTKTD